jgi:hypothetical protein
MSVLGSLCDEARVDTLAELLLRAQPCAAGATVLLAGSAAGAANRAPAEADDHDGARDFDFLAGRWRVRNERLRRRLAGCDDWQSFDAIVESRPILGGLGNIDEFVTDEFDAEVYIGMALRLFDGATRRWSIWWSSNRRGVLEPPVVGGFADGVGRFEGDDVHDGRPVRVRFVWTDIGADHARWEQAFSADGGATWEVNWRMQFRRMDARATEVAA